MKLLCIEDNDELIASLRHFLGHNSTIESAGTGKEGIDLAARNPYDAIVLDLGLPDIPGQEVCTSIRETGINTPMLVLSAVKEPNTKVSLLEAGADDYMTKPFAVAELRARLLALLRRGNSKSDASKLCTLRIGDLTLDPISRRVERSGQTIKLRRKEFDILEYMMLNHDKILTRFMIMENVWEAGSSSWDSTVNVHIKHLRDKVDRPFGHKLIKTAYGLGYTISDKM